jgi:5'-nucleotidase
MEDLLKSLLSSVSSTLSKPVCWSLTPFDARSEIVRTQETGLGNWMADVLMHAYAESLLERGPEDKSAAGGGETGSEVLAPPKKANGTRNFGGIDAVIICGGTLRGDSQYGPGKITLGDILGEQCSYVFPRRLFDLTGRRDPAVRGPGGVHRD